MTVVLPPAGESVTTMSAHASPHDRTVSRAHVIAVAPGAVSVSSNEKHFIRIVVVAPCMPVMPVGRVHLDPPVASVICVEREVDVHVTPAVLVTVDVSTELAMIVELRVAPGVPASVAHGMPPDLEISMRLCPELSVVAVLNIKVFVFVGVPPGKCCTIPLPAASPM